MTMKTIIERLRQRRTTKPDWTRDLSPRDLSPRDWADLPVHHPRHEEDAA